MNYQSLWLSCAATILLSGATHAADDGGFFIRGNLGLATGETEVSRSTGSKTGVTFGGQLGTRGSVVDLALDVAVQPFKVENPRRSEAFTALYILPSLQFHWASAYVRGGVGWSRLSFSGNDIFVAKDGGFSWGVAAGYERGASKRPLGIEVFTLRTASSDGELGASLTGVRVTLAWYSGR